MWQTKYASAVPKNLGLGLNFWPCSEGYFLSGRPYSVPVTILRDGERNEKLGMQTIIEVTGLMYLLIFWVALCYKKTNFEYIFLASFQTFHVLIFYFVRILPIFIMYISLILPTEIWEIILDCLSSQGLLNFQHTCHAWREIVLNYIINGRLKNRSFVRGPFVSFKQLHQVTILCTISE